MGKRKWNDFNENDDAGESFAETQVRTKKKKAGEKIGYGKKLLNQALKTARGFERQKLGRRHKIAAQKGDPAEVARIDAEIQALKALDLPVAAEHYICKTLLKIKRVASSPALPEIVHSHKRPPLDTPTANVCARLYNSNPVKQTFPEILNSIQKALGVKDANGTVSKRVRRTERSISTSTVDGNGPVNHVEMSSADERENGPTFDRAGNRIDSSRSGREEHMSSGEEGSDGIFSELDARIARSSEDESDMEGSAFPRMQSRKRSSPSRSTSVSPSVSEPSPPSKRSKLAKHTAVFASGATYLPGLSNVGYVSGSESEASDDIDIEPRKNRRGQRARQQLWEKKYGAKAKHLRKQWNENTNRDTGWDPKRGARDESGKFRKRGHTSNGTRPSGRTGGNSVPLSNRKVETKDNGGPLHPSWQAAKKAKEHKVTAPFQGRKVTFT